MKVSVIVCTKGRETLKECIASLKDQDCKDYEIITVSPKKIAFRGTKNIIEKAKGISKARNTGIKAAKGEIVAFIDDDAVADPNWLSNLVRHYKSGEVMCVGGKIVPFATRPHMRRLLKKYELHGFLGLTSLKHRSAKAIKSPALWACNLSFRKSLFERVGLFDERLGRAPGDLSAEEEVDMELRTLNSGYNIIYEPEAIVRHKVAHRLDSPYLIRRAYWQGYSEALRILRTHLVPISKSLLRHYANYKFYSLVLKSYSGGLRDKINSAEKLGRFIALCAHQE